MSWTILPVTEFASRLPEWKALNERGPRTLLLDPDFMLPLVEIFGTGREVLAVRENAMALLTPKGLGRWETFQPSQAPLGAWVSTGDDHEALLGSLVRALPGVALSVGVTQQDPDLDPRPDTTGRLKTLDYIDTARITVDGTWEEYWQTRGRNLRKNMRRQRSKLDREGVETRLEALTRPDDVAQAIREYGQLESAGWKAAGGTAIHPDNDQGIFYRRLFEEFCARDEAVIYRYFYNGAFAASDLCIQRDGTLVILKTTYDESIESTSPALLMRQEAFEQLFATGTLKRIEFYGKVMDWHTKWSDEIRRMYHVTAYRWALLPRLLARSSAA